MVGKGKSPYKAPRAVRQFFDLEAKSSQEKEEVPWDEIMEAEELMVGLNIVLYWQLIALLLCSSILLLKLPEMINYNVVYVYLQQAAIEKREKEDREAGAAEQRVSSTSCKVCML